MTLNNVHIRNEPPTVTYLEPLPAPPSSTAKPLYGAENKASKVLGVLFALLLTVLFAILFAVIM